MKRKLGMLISEAAEYLKVSTTTLRRREKTGELLPDITDRETGYRYYFPESLKAYRENRFKGKIRKQAGDNTGKLSFRFIDLFSGIGGLRIPFDDMGGTCVFSSEIDPYAVKTYETMFGETPHGDITKISEEEIPSHDILIAGFPCQPFSIAGVSKYNSLGWGHGFMHTTKGTLFFDIARILAYHKPKAFLLENVKNLRSHNGGKTFSVIMQTLKDELGYKTVEAKVLDARYVVPQHRERIFIVGFLKETSFSLPELPDLNPKLKDILDPDPDPRYTLSDRLWSYLQKYSEKHKSKGNGFGYGLADLKGITRTLSARYYKDGSEILIPQEGKNPRRLSPAECSELMGFPKKYRKLPVCDTQAYKQFGNAVVVPVVRHVAGALMEKLVEIEPEFGEQPRELETAPLFR